MQWMSRRVDTTVRFIALGTCEIKLTTLMDRGKLGSFVQAGLGRAPGLLSTCQLFGFISVEGPIFLENLVARIDRGNRSPRNRQICCCIVMKYVEKDSYNSGTSQRNYHGKLFMV